MTFPKRDGAEKAAAEAAYRMLAVMSHSDKDPGLLQILGNRIVEEAALLGGPLGELAAEFGEKLAMRGLSELVRKKKQGEGIE